MSAITPAMRTITRHLSDEEKQELADIMDYTGEKVASGHLPEGSMASLFNRASPRVRDVLSTISNTMETPRVEPYAPKLSEQQVAHGYGLDIDTATTAKAALDGQYVTTRLQERMGTDSSRPDEAPSLRDMISAAADHHEKGDSNA